MERQPNRECGYCHRPFWRKPSLPASKSGLYFCSAEHRKLAILDPDIPVSTGVRKNPDNLFCTSCQVRHHSKVGTLCRSCSNLLLIEQWFSGDLSVTRQARNGEPRSWVKRCIIDMRGDACEACGFDQKAPDGRSIIQMDHSDGNYLNNSLDNLRLLCPNCHAMTTTYGGRNRNSGRRHRRKFSS